jgi:hypothetical protein
MFGRVFFSVSLSFTPFLFGLFVLFSSFLFFSFFIPFHLPFFVLFSFDPCALALVGFISSLPQFSCDKLDYDKIWCLGIIKRWISEGHQNIMS